MFCTCTLHYNSLLFIVVYQKRTVHLLLHEVSCSILCSHGSQHVCFIICSCNWFVDTVSVYAW